MDQKFEGIITENAGGFGSAIAKVELHFAVEVQEFGSRLYQLHVFHGSPAYSNWWQTGFGIIASDLSLTRAKRLIDTLVGREGAHQFFRLVSRYSGPAAGTPLSLLQGDAQ